MDETALLRSNWWAYLLRGLVAIIFGILVLVWPGATTLVLIILFGAFALVDGVFSLVASIMAAKRGEKWASQLLLGLVGILIGVVVLARPGVGILAVLLVIAIWAIITGFISLFTAIELPREVKGRWVLGLAGVLAIIVGILLIAFPIEGVFAVVLFIGILAIILGLLNFVLGFMVRKMEKELPAV